MVMECIAPSEYTSHHLLIVVQVVPSADIPSPTNSVVVRCVWTSCSPRLRAATIHQSSPIKPPVSSSSSSSSTFQKDLSRLLDPDISDYDLHRTLSEKVCGTRSEALVRVAHFTQLILVRLIPLREKTFGNCCIPFLQVNAASYPLREIKLLSTFMLSNGVNLPSCVVL